jgi:N-acetylneuraminic acid mutarotase
MTANIGLAGVYSGLTDNKLLILGGSNFPGLPPWENGSKSWWNDLYCYDTIQKRWKIQKNFLEAGRAYGLSIQLKDGFVGIGGCDEKQCYKTIFFVKQEGDSIICDTTTYPPLPITLANMSGTLLNNKIYVAGGQETIINGKSSKHFLVLDISSKKKEWIELPSWKGHSLSYSVCTTQSGKVFLFGGRSFGPGEETVVHTEGYCFDPETNEWKTLSGQFPVMAGTAMPFGENKILFFGGVPEILPTNLSHPGFSSSVLLFDTQKETLEKIDSSRIPIPVTTHLVHKDNYFFITSGEIKPGVRTPYILQGVIKKSY